MNELVLYQQHSIAWLYHNLKILRGKCEITSCCGIPVGEIVVGGVVGFVVGLTLLGFMAKHTTYGFGEKV